MNVKLSYLYRDGGNYKNYGIAIFSNPNSVSINFIISELQKHLIDKVWFKANQWSLPDLHFTEYSWDTDIDHEWHEFQGLQESVEGPTEKLSIEEFLAEIKNRNIIE